MFKKILVGAMALLLIASASLATVTPSGVTKTTWGNKRIAMGTIVITGAPAALGYALTAKAIGLTKISQIYFYPNYSYPDYSWTYSSTGTGGYIVPMRVGWLGKKQILAAGISDTISIVSMKPGNWAADADTATVLIQPVMGSIARFCVPKVIGTTEAHATTYKQDNVFTAGDGLTMGCVSDTGWVHGGPVLRDSGYYNGDTLYFLPAADPEDRLAYSGNNTLGAAVAGTYASLYVPFGQGNYIKVDKLTGAALYAAGARAVHYAPNGALTAKFLANKTAGPKIGALPITVDRVPTTSNGFTAYLYFIAIGN